MKAKLRVLQGKLRTRRGDSAGLEISIRGPRFLVGSSAECKLCCQSPTISAQHCVLSPNRDALWVHDLDSETGTFVNDVRSVGKTRLLMGDRLRIGRLEFEVVITAEPESTPRRDQASEPDSMSEFVSDLLGEADAAERTRRMADPTARQFSNSSVEVEAKPAEAVVASKPVARPNRQPPKKLPPAPELVADDSVQAAEETLKQILARLKGPMR